ncbi:MAG: rod shape-determining protein MreD [Proteobacteria bacterium]|jgi:rod shape-determining protein MreD|nr:rod shape-determining protein MreD [Pseudomonadota bacterium]MDA0993601.1 rod shape-determining protein MreD [Pseudomonadota bacterium]
MSDARISSHLPIIFSIAVALLLSIAPIPDSAEPFRPTWVLLTLIYWAMTLPDNYSVGSAWIAGLILDVAQGTLLGQHAIGLSLVIYVTVKFHLQLRQFPMMQLSITVFALLALYQFILFWINGVAGVNSESVIYWGPVLTGTLIWPLLNIVFVGIRQRARG